MGMNSNTAFLFAGASSGTPLTSPLFMMAKVCPWRFFICLQITRQSYEKTEFRLLYHNVLLMRFDKNLKNRIFLNVSVHCNAVFFSPSPTGTPLTSPLGGIH